MKELTHLPTHPGKVTKGRIAEPGDRITCKPCLRILAEAAVNMVASTEGLLDRFSGRYDAGDWTYGPATWGIDEYRCLQALSAGKYAARNARLVLDFGASLPTERPFNPNHGGYVRAPEYYAEALRRLAEVGR